MLGQQPTLNKACSKPKMLLQLFSLSTSLTVIFVPQGISCNHLYSGCRCTFYLHWNFLTPSPPLLSSSVSSQYFPLSHPPSADAVLPRLHHIELSVIVGPHVSLSLMDGEHVGGAAVLNRHGGLKRWGSKC